MDTLLRAIHDTSPAMETFLRPGHTGDFGVPDDLKDVLRTDLVAEPATGANGTVDLNRHAFSSY
jgi:hypothetical protein